LKRDQPGGRRAVARRRSRPVHLANAELVRADVNNSLIKQPERRQQLRRCQVRKLGYTLFFSVSNINEARV